MNEINKPLLSDKKLIDIIEEIELCYVHYIEQCDLIDSQLLNTKNNQLNYEIENRISLKGNYQQLITKINQALDQDNVININEYHKNRFNEIREVCEKRYNKIIDEYNKLYVFVGDEDSAVIKEKETNNPSTKKVYTAECSSSISSNGNSIEVKKKETREDTDRYILFVVIAIFLFLAFLLMFYFNKMMK